MDCPEGLRKLQPWRTAAPLGMSLQPDAASEPAVTLKLALLWAGWRPADLRRYHPLNYCMIFNPFSR